MWCRLDSVDSWKRACVRAGILACVSVHTCNFNCVGAGERWDSNGKQEEAPWCSVIFTLSPQPPHQDRTSVAPHCLPERLPLCCDTQGERGGWRKGVRGVKRSTGGVELGADRLCSPFHLRPSNTNTGMRAYIQTRRHTFLYYTPNGATHPMQKWQLFVWHVFNHANTQTVQEVFHSKLVWDLLSSWLDTLYALLKDSKLVTCNTRVLTLRCFTAQHLKITNSLC